MSERSPLAALIYQEDEKIDEFFAELRRTLAARGLVVGGVVQSPCEDTVFAHHLDSGRQIDLMQNLGACAEGCRLDTAALAEVAGLLAQSLVAAPDLLLVSRFGRAEAEGGGFLAEIGAAACAGTPTLVGLSARRLAEWRAYAGDIAEALPLSQEAVLAWLKDVTQKA